MSDCNRPTLDLTDVTLVSEVTDEDDGYPAYSHQSDFHKSDSHQVGIWHNDEGRKYDAVKFPPTLRPGQTLANTFEEQGPH